MVLRRHFGIAIVACVVWGSSSGCALGPTALRASRMPYNKVIHRTTNEQLLLNLVRLRYHEPIVFLEVGSITANFTFRDSGEISGTLNENVGPEPITADAFTLGANITYEEHPAITFTPLQGEEFAKRLLRPIKVETIMWLSRSGWSIDRVLQVTAQGINGLDNGKRASRAVANEERPYEEFVSVCERLRDLQDMDLLHIGLEAEPDRLVPTWSAKDVTPDHVLEAAQKGYRLEMAEKQKECEEQTADKQNQGDKEKKPDEQKVQLTCPPTKFFWEIPREARGRWEASEIVRLLDLEPDRDRYEVTERIAEGWPAPAKKNKKWSRIHVANRSLMSTLFYLSHAVKIPPEHEIADREGKQFDWDPLFKEVLDVRYQLTPPWNAAVAVRHRGYWFYIKDSDLNCQKTFALLAQLFSLQAVGEIKVAPVLTLPVGGGGTP